LYTNHDTLTSNQIVLITTPDIGSSENIQDYATLIGNELGVGQKDKDNGVIIVFSAALRKTSIATVLGTKLILTDSIANFVVQNQMIPKFKKGEIDEGLYDGSKWITDILEKPENIINAVESEENE
tara:strand:+ start:207 stop:584 length:378 start_codon:yes stop_codon:yes gene_type:complete